MTSDKKNLNQDSPSEQSALTDWEKHREALLDQALEESFPASDPPAISSDTSGAARAEESRS